MAELRMENVLDLCIDEVQSGRASLDACLERYPGLRSELEPLLRLALQISPLQVAPEPSRRLAARARFVEALYQPTPPSGLRGLLHRVWSKPFTAGVVGALTLATSGGAVYAAADQSLPGDALYGVKVVIEDARVAVAPSEEAKLQAELEVAGHRVAEVAQALESQRPEAAQAAAEGYARVVNQAQQRLERLAPPAATAVAVLVQEKLEQQEQALAMAASGAPPTVRNAVERARDKAATSAPLAVAKAERTPRPTSTPVNGRGTSTANRAPTPSPTSVPARVIADLNALEQQTGQVAPQTSAPPREATNAEQDLQAELEGVRTALSEGRIQAARNRLDAFRNQLEALRRSGRISDDLYQQLSTAALQLRDDLIVDPTSTPSRPRTPQATATPRRTPTPQPRRSQENTQDQNNDLGGILRRIIPGRSESPTPTPRGGGVQPGARSEAGQPSESEPRPTSARSAQPPSGGDLDRLSDRAATPAPTTVVPPTPPQ